jgi:sugar phosphate isomerase/epimerase
MTLKDDRPVAAASPAQPDIAPAHIDPAHIQLLNSTQKGQTIMANERPILISVIQYLPQLESGSLKISELVNKARDFGVDGVELRREAWPAYKTELPAVRKQIEELGLVVTYATFSTLFNQDEAAHALLLEDVRTAAALGAPLLRVFPGATPADDDAQGWAKGREAVDLAGSLGIQLALENFARTPGGTLAEVANILQKIDTPALRANIDIGNYPLHNQDPIQAIQAIGHKAIYCHVKDYGGSPDAGPVRFGEGVLPLADIFAALDQLPQRVILCFEFSGGPDPDQHIRDAFALAKTLKNR